MNSPTPQRQTLSDADSITSERPCTAERRVWRRSDSFEDPNFDMKPSHRCYACRGMRTERFD